MISETNFNSLKNKGGRVFARASAQNRKRVEAGVANFGEHLGEIIERTKQKRNWKFS